MTNLKWKATLQRNELEWKATLQRVATSTLLVSIAVCAGCALQPASGSFDDSVDASDNGPPTLEEAETQTGSDAVRAQAPVFSMWVDTRLPAIAARYEGAAAAVAHRRMYVAGANEVRDAARIAVEAYASEFNVIGPTRALGVTVDDYRFGGADPSARFTLRIASLALMVTPEEASEAATFEISADVTISDATGEYAPITFSEYANTRAELVDQSAEALRLAARTLAYRLFDKAFRAFTRLPVFAEGAAPAAIVTSVYPDDGASTSTLQDGAPETGLTLTALEDEVVDEGVLSDTYSFLPLWVGLRLSQPTVLNSVVLGFDASRSSELVNDRATTPLVHVLVSDAVRPGAPSPASSMWREVMTFPLKAPREPHSMPDVTARHVALWFEAPFAGAREVRVGLNDVEVRHAAQRIVPIYIEPEDQRSWAGGGVPGCFAAGTLISTPSGRRAIESIRSGDMVWSYEATTGRRVEGRVAMTQITPSYAVGVLHLGDGRLVRTTPDHPFFRLRNDVSAQTPADEASGKSTNEHDVSARLFARKLRGTRVPGPRPGTVLEVCYASDLREGDIVVVEGNHGRLREISVRGFTLSAGTTTVYNFKVERHHAYFAEGVLVHNR